MLINNQNFIPFTENRAFQKKASEDIPGDKVIFSGKPEELPFYKLEPAGMSGERIGHHSQTFNDVINLLGQAVNQDFSVKNDLDTVSRNIKDAQRDLQSSKWDIRDAQNDDKDKNVSQKGHSIDRAVKSAEQDLSSADMTVNYASRGINSTEGKVADSFKKLDDLGKQLTAAGGYEQVVGLIEQAKKYLNSSYQEAGRTSQDINDTDRNMEDASRELRFSEHNIMNIKFDGPGKDVSRDADQVGYKVDNAEWKLRDADREVSSARTGLSGIDNNINQALNAIRNAQSLYNSHG